MPALAERLKEYEEHRDRYPDFASFAPRLMAVFDELAATELPPAFYEIPLSMTIDGAVSASIVHPPVNSSAYHPGCDHARGGGVAPCSRTCAAGDRIQSHIAPHAARHSAASTAAVTTSGHE